MIPISTSSKRRMSKPLFVSTLALLLMLLLSACNGTSQTRQQSGQNKQALDSALAQARSIGVPASLLQPIVQQEAQLGTANAPFGFFNNQGATNYYSNLGQRYQMLAVQTRGLMAQVTQQFDYQATLDLHTLERVLAQRQAQGFIEAKTFADQLTHDQKMMAKAQYPEEYIQIGDSAKSSTQALRLMGPAYANLTTLQQTISQLQASHLDVTALSQQEQYDLQMFRSANVPQDFSRIIDQTNAQLQETAVLSIQVIPYVGAAKLRQFSNDIAQMKQYGIDTSVYQKMLAADQTSLNNAKSLSDFLKVSSQLDADTSSIQLPMMQVKASALLNQFHQEVTAWGNSHQYHDPNNGNNYNLDYEYDQQGIGSDADAALQAAQTVDDYQAVIDLVNNDILNLHAMEADYSDQTAWSLPHATDLQLMQHYNVMSGQVIVVSLVEQVLRLYQNGNLVQSFQITSGQYEKPSVPGFWHIFLRQSPTVFKSSEPVGSAFWYPNTNINFALEYHDGGYFFHDSWWRVNYGQGTNFPHYDTGGDESFAGNGSHGCINMQEQQAGWLYNHTGYGTAVIMY